MTDQPYVVIRARDAGVFAGKLLARNGSAVRMNNCRRLWQWAGAASLSQLAVEGIRAAGVASCKFSVPTDGHEILGVIEVIPMSADAKDSVYAVPEWRA